jgi:hypothetical protein
MLNKDNYFSLNNGFLTNSKIGDFLKCPEYFYKKHITGEIERDVTSAMSVGKGVDELLTQDKIESMYFVAGDRRTKGGKAEAQEKIEQGYEIISAKEYEDMMALAIAVERTKAYKQLKDFTAQEILAVEMELGEHFKGIAGIPDFYKINPATNKCIIVDLKTARTVEPRPYHFHCLDFGYYRQFAMYSILLKAKYPKITEFEYFHLTVDKTKDINHVRTLRLANLDVNDEIENLENIFKAIKNTKKFVKYNPRFEEAQMIGRMEI